MSVQVFGDNGQGGFAEGFTYAADMGAHVSQNSWGGGGESQSINDAIDYFIANGGGAGTPMDGGVVIFAAGNDDVSSGASTWPAQYESAIAVASTDHNDVKSYFSNYGSWVDIAAPGSDILSCKPNDSYQTMSGTSMACPHVSGVAALIVSKFAGNITPSEVRSRLIDYTDNIDDENSSYVGQLGSGRLNAYASLSGDAPEPPDATYCTSQGNDASYEWISKVEIGTYSNSSGGAGYTDFTNETIELNAGQSYSITLTPGFSNSTYQEYWKIWIDYNNDTTFTSDELAYDAGSTSSSAVSGTINIPSDVSGLRRMRVSMKYNGEQSACETFDYGEVEDYNVNISTGGGDTEAPTAPTNLTAGNVTETSVDLSWDASSDNVGVDHYTVFQDGSSIGTTSNTSYSVTGLTAATTYTFTVKAEDAAGNVSASSNALDVTTNDGSVSYCSSQGNNSSYEWISQVDIGNFSNSSGAAGYTDFTGQTVNLTAGASVSVTLTPGFSGSTYNEYWKIWIDYNGDGDFSDNGELVFDPGSMSSSAVSGTINVASTASGTTRMRVTMKYNGEPSPCETFSYGGVEDYTVSFSGGGDDTEAPTAPTSLASSNITSSSVDLNWSASSDNVGVDHYTIFQDGSSIGTTSNTSTTVSGLAEATTYSFYVKAEDAAGNVSTASNSIDVTTESGSVSYCESYGNNTNYEWIDLVELGSINNTTSADGGYGDYTNLSTDLTRGSNVTIYISAGFASSSYTEYWHVWIDFDQNGTFDSDEEMVSGSSSSADKLSASFDVPTDAVLGQTRMRVTMKYNSAATACESFSYGEVEDYTVNITDNSTNYILSNRDAMELGNAPAGLEIYPNPANSFVNVQINEGERNSTVSIYNTQGSLVKIVPVNSDFKEIDVSDLQGGVYILKVADERLPLVKQFIKK